MEQNIKNFDRGIEQKMNEHEVAPPFGMWNRISAELEAMPIAATTAPVVTSLIPKRAMLGIIAAALVIGTSVLTGYMVNSSVNSSKENANIANTTKPANGNTVAQQTQPVKADVVTPLVASVQPKVKRHAAGNPMQTTLQVAQQVKPINEPVAQTTQASEQNNNSLIINNNTDVPTPLEPVAQSNEMQQYYFPPIDVNTPEKAKTESEPAFTVKKPAGNMTASADNKDESFGSTNKMKFRPHKRKKFTYGSIIR